MTEEDAGGPAPLLSPARLLRILLAHLKPDAARAALLVATLLAEGAFNVLLALSLKFIIDFAITPRDSRLLTLVLAGLLLGSLLTAGAQVARDYLYAWLGSRVVGRVRAEMFRHLQTLSPGFYARARLGDLSARFSSDLSAIENAVVLGIPGALLCVINIAFSACVLFALDWRLALDGGGGTQSRCRR